MPDERFDWLVQYWKPASAVPAHLSVVDIAGLVKGAHEGQVCMHARIALHVHMYDYVQITGSVFEL